MGEKENQIPQVRLLLNARSERESVSPSTSTSPSPSPSLSPGKRRGRGREEKGEEKAEEEEEERRLGGRLSPVLVIAVDTSPLLFLAYPAPFLGALR